MNLDSRPVAISQAPLKPGGGYSYADGTALRIQSSTCAMDALAHRGDVAPSWTLCRSKMPSLGSPPSGTDGTSYRVGVLHPLVSVGQSAETRDSVVNVSEELSGRSLVDLVPEALRIHKDSRLAINEHRTCTRCVRRRSASAVGTPAVAIAGPHLCI